MRISTAYQYDSYSRSISEAARKVEDAQTRAQSGKRIMRASDDPAGAANVVRLSAVKASLTQYRANAASAKGLLSVTESTLSSINDLTKQAYELAVRGANDTQTKETRATMATQIADLQQSLLNLGNTRDGVGGYIFAGQKTDTAPFTANKGKLDYNGDSGIRTAEVSADQVLTTNTQGSPLLTDLYARLETLRKALSENDGATIAKSSVGDLKQSVTTIAQERGTVGSKLTTISDLTTQHQRREDELTSRISDTEDIDFSKAILEYQQAQTAYEASLNVASQGSKLSLMDFIRG